MPTPVLDLQSPFQRLFGMPPNYERLKVFGCLCFPWLRPYTRHKLEDRSKHCVFIGYSMTQSTYFCLDVATGRIYTSKHVQFDENNFPFQTSPLPQRQPLDTVYAHSTPLATVLPLSSASSATPQQPPCSVLHPDHPLPPPVLPTTSVNSQVSSSVSGSKSSSSLSNSEPTAPIQNGPEIVVQTNLNTLNIPPTEQGPQPNTFIGPLPTPNPTPSSSPLSTTNNHECSTSTIPN